MGRTSSLDVGTAAGSSGDRRKVRWAKSIQSRANNRFVAKHQDSFSSWGKASYRNQNRLSSPRDQDYCREWRSLDAGGAEERRP